MGTRRSVKARRAERRRRLRRTVLGSTALVALSGATYWLGHERGASTAARGGPSPATGRAAAPAEHAAPPPSPSPTASPTASPSTNPSPSPTKAPGEFTASATAGRTQGEGRPRRWRVETENSSGVDPESAARDIEAILGDRRGWIRDPSYGFRLAGPGEPVDFTVKIATPATTDRLCEVVTPELIGETNCQAHHTIVVNLKRWKEGSPKFRGSAAEYRALIINHEVGHELGRGHETCPRPGAPAPAMMQQIKGLQGCTSNAWPHTAGGTYLAGPPVP
ncbi:DUF3152 domain-containing protein [Streptomyces sp. NPDC004126]|uniref:DUF3152 domain-containing protein n=1 Tax=Streptomyces sp. NPDC004126 TaxID=3390695 RepID=UPI003CFF1024